MEAVNHLTLASFLWMSHPTFSPFLSALLSSFLLSFLPLSFFKKVLHISYNNQSYSFRFPSEPCTVAYSYQKLNTCWIAIVC